MSLIKCPECGKEISSSAKMCPNCGYEIKTKIKNKENGIDKHPIYSAFKTAILIFLVIFVITRGDIVSKIIAEGYTLLLAFAIPIIIVLLILIFIKKSK